jgi:predicted alpha/beta hydrolase
MPRGSVKRARNTDTDSRRKRDLRSRPGQPRSSFDELEIHTSDGAVLRAIVDDPPEGVPLRATLVLAHAMFARKSSFGRRDSPGLSSALVKRGFRTIAFDFRGHGDSSSPGGSNGWGYDDLVRVDLPAVVESARTRSGAPVIVVGHSLGGHVALAAQGTGRIDADAIVAIATNVWLPDLERSRIRRGAKTGIARVMLAVADRVGSIPARRLRIGSDDASGRYTRDLLRVVTAGVWGSADGDEDYLDALRNVKIPVAAVLGDRDRIMCHPSAGEAFARRCTGPVQVFRAPVGHMELVTSEIARHSVVDAVDWALVRSLGRASQARP